MGILKLLILFFFIQCLRGYGQLHIDSGKLQLSIIDTSTRYEDSVKKIPVVTYQSILNKLLSANKYINVNPPPVIIVAQKRDVPGKEYLFYLLSSILLIFGLFKIFYAAYFHNIFRVFFNTSLRQNQLTDLLLQARLPSLIFNIFFTITAGLYTWFLLTYYFFTNEPYNYKILLFCTAAIGLIYITKFCVLKFIGWITEMKTAVNTYIFIIFLINKIVGVTLIPFIIFLAFAPVQYFKTIVILSFIVLIIFFIMRFFRSYNLLQHQLNLSRVHFLLYIISLEVLPLLVIYKLVTRSLLKSI